MKNITAFREDIKGTILAETLTFSLDKIVLEKARELEKENELIGFEIEGERLGLIFRKKESKNE